MYIRLSIILATGLLIIPCDALAQTECAGSLSQSDFYDQMKELSQKTNQNVVKYRKIESSLQGTQPDSPEAKEFKEQLAKVEAELGEQKKLHQILNAKYFPRTDVTALGGACRDRRWVEEGKQHLLSSPDKMGRHFFVWLDKGTRKAKASETRPKREAVAD